MPTPTYVAPSEAWTGDTIAFKVSAPDTPADSGWTGAAALFGTKKIPATVTADGADFLVTFAATDTEKLATGNFIWRLTASKAGEVVTVDEGSIRIREETLEHCQIMLALIRSALEGRITSDHESYSIGGRSISKIGFEALYRAEVKYSARVKRLMNRGKPQPSMQFRFVPPGSGVAG